MSALLESIWWSERPGVAGAVLAPPLLLAEAIFRAGAALRGALYDAGILRAARAGVPVVSIGNLAVGGAGKTPATIAVARRLRSRGRRVAVLSRGYGASRSDARVVSDGVTLLLGAAEGGDEPVLVARRLPGTAVLCGPRRAALAHEAVGRLGADALVLDDGFQHRALARELDVVVLDAANPFGNGRLLPAGPNREPRSALRRAGLVWLSRVDQAEPSALAALRALASEATGTPPVESRHAPVELVDGALARPSPSRSSAGAGSSSSPASRGRPGSGARSRRSGRTSPPRRSSPTTTGSRRPTSTARAASRTRAGCELLVTTEKDAVRLPPSAAADPRVRAVRIEAELVRGAEHLDQALDAALGAPAAIHSAPRGARV